MTGTGTSWPYTSYTPTYTNITVGSGTNTAWYKQIGKTVHYYGRWVYGAGSAVGSNPTVSLPVTASSNYNVEASKGITFIGDVRFLDSGTANYAGVAGITNDSGLTKFQLLVFNASGAYTTIGGLTSAIPHTWASADEIEWSVTYEAA